MDISTKDCCGCGMCAMICSRNAIEIKYDTGFPLPAIDRRNVLNVEDVMLIVLQI